MRLDKFLCDSGAGTRSEVKQMLKKGFVTVNGKVEKAAEKRIAEEADTVCLRGEPVVFQKHRYYLLHKPAGVITATKDARQRTVLDLLSVPCAERLSPVGRLDKDTEGLLLLTDDGALAHKLLSPKKHVDKIYFVQIKYPLTAEMEEALTLGVMIGDETPTLPARVVRLSEKEIELTIREGRFHQIKRMLEAVGNQVTYLKRLSMGPLTLPPDLERGAFRPLNETEIEQLKQEKLL